MRVVSGNQPTGYLHLGNYSRRQPHLGCGCRMRWNGAANASISLATSMHSRTPHIDPAKLFPPQSIQEMNAAH